MGSALLEVVVRDPADAEAAAGGGADRLCIASTGPNEPVSAEPALVASVCASTSVPVRAVLRLSEGFGTTGGELSRLIGLGADYLAGGAEGLVFGFLSPDLEVDVAVCAEIADAVGGAPWSFSRAIDHALDTDRAWRQVRSLPGLDTVLTAGSALGLATGLPHLIDRATADTDVARLAMAADGLTTEHVPWLMRAGVSAFQVGPGPRPGESSTGAHVDKSYVRSWRILLDDASSRQTS